MLLHRHIPNVAPPRTDRQTDRQHPFFITSRVSFAGFLPLRGRHEPPQGFLGGKFDAEIKKRADGIVNATIEIYERISKELLPTPAR